MDKKDLNKSILIIIGCIILPHGVASQSLWKDSVEFIKFDNYGYDKIIFYPDCTFLQLYYSNARMDIAEYSRGKYLYDEDSKIIIIRSGPNYIWDISVDTSFSGDDSLVLNLRVGDEGVWGLLLLVNEDTVDLSQLDKNVLKPDNQGHNLTNGIGGRSFCIICKESSDIVFIDKVSADTVFSYHGRAGIVDITLERNLVLFADKYVQFKNKMYLVDENFNLRDVNGELTYYLFDKTGLKRFPLMHDHIND